MHYNIIASSLLEIDHCCNIETTAQSPRNWRFNCTTGKNSTKIPLLLHLTQNLREFQYKLDEIKKEHDEEVKKMCPIPKKVGFLTPCLPLKEEESRPVEKDDTVTYTLKIRANATGQNVQTYKRILRRFNEGSPEAFIKTLQGLREIWTQNLVNSANDREATVKTVLRGESLHQFESRLGELTTTTNDDGTNNIIPATSDHIDDALNEVGRNVFPHRALENQKQWMRRHLRKTVDMPFRTMASSVVRINSYLPFLPDATENDKFSDAELVELLEFSLPYTWRSKFDLEGYVPMHHDRQELVRKCEALERSLPASGKTIPAKGKKAFSKHKPGNKNGTKYCSLHGKGNHDTANCITLKRRAKEGNKPNGKFNKEKFRKEVNAISKRSKRQALDNFAAVIKAERKKLSEALKNGSDSEDDSSEMSLGNIEEPDRTFRPSKKVTFSKKGKKALKAKKRSPSKKSIVKSLKSKAIPPQILDRKPFSRTVSPNSPDLEMLSGKDIKSANLTDKSAKVDATKKLAAISAIIEKARNEIEAGSKIAEIGTNQNIENKTDILDAGTDTDDLTARLERLGLPLKDAPDEDEDASPAGAQKEPAKQPAGAQAEASEPLNNGCEHPAGAQAEPAGAQDESAGAQS